MTLVLIKQKSTQLKKFDCTEYWQAQSIFKPPLLTLTITIITAILTLPLPLDILLPL